MKKLFLLCILIVILGCGCGKRIDVSSRESMTTGNYDKVKIGVAAPVEVVFPACYYDEGIDLAVKEINASGGVLGKELEVVVKDDQGNVETGMKVAESFAADPEVVAVIGHWYSDVSVAVAATYQRAGVLMMNTVSSNDSITEMGQSMIFRLGMKDSMMAVYASELASQDGMQNMAIYYTDNEYGRGLANAFEAKAGGIGINIVDRVSNFKNSHEMELYINKWALMDTQGIFIADVYPHAAEIIKELHDSGYTGRIYGGDGLDNDGMIDQLGLGAEGLTIPTVFDPKSDNRDLQLFVKQFKKDNGGHEPDIYAALGYESVRLIAAAINQSGTLHPSGISKTLHSVKGYRSVFGKLNIGKDGQATGMNFSTKRVSHGRFIIDKGGDVQ